MFITLKESPSVLKILLQRGNYDMFDGWDISNECKISIQSGFLIKMPSQKEKITCTLVSLIMHDGELLDFVHYVSDVFDTSTGIWWHCDDDDITEISYFQKVYIIERVEKECY